MDTQPNEPFYRRTERTPFTFPLVSNLTPEQLIKYYFTLSYLYYEKDTSVVSDDYYDRLCKRLYEEWDSFEHPYKEKVERETLLAGTGFGLEYSERMKGAALWLYYNAQHIDPNTGGVK